MHPTQTVHRLGSGFPLGWYSRGGAGLGWGGCGAEIQRTLLPMLPMLPTQTVHRLIWPSAVRARGWGGDTTDIAPHAPYANSPPAGLARCGAGAGLGRGYNGICPHAPYANSPPAGLARCGAGAGLGRGYNGICPHAPYANSPPAGLARCGAGAGLGRGYNGICPHAPYANSPHAGLAWCGAGAGLGRVRSGDTTDIAPYAPYANSPPADLAECGAGAWLGRGYNGHCSPCTLPKQSPGWEVVFRLAGAARGQCWDTTDIAPLLRTQTVPRLGSGFPLGWGGAGPVLGYNGHCSLAPHANSPPAGKWFSAWLGRRGASAGIQRTLLPCSACKQSPGWEVVLPLGWYSRGGAGLGRVRSGDTTDIAPYAPYANSPRLVGPGRRGASAGIQRHLLPMHPTQTVPMLVWPGAERAWGLGREYNGICSPCTLRKQSTG